VVRVGHELAVSAWREPPSAIPAERFADVHFGTEVFAVGGTELGDKAVIQNKKLRDCLRHAELLAGRHFGAEGAAWVLALAPNS
jgi:hypothetical protein